MSERMKKDGMDFTKDRYSILSDIPIGIPLGLTLARPIAAAVLGPEVVSMSDWATALIYYSIAPRVFVSYGHQDTVNLGHWENSELHYEFRPYVYRGQPLKLGEGELKEGDSFIHLNMPVLSEEDFEKVESSPEAAQAWTECNAFILKGVSAVMDREGFEILAVDGLPQEESFPIYTHEELFAGKGVVLSEPDWTTTILTRDELEVLTINQADFFLRGVEALNDIPALEYLEIAKTTFDFERRKKAVLFLTERIRTILEQEVEIQFNNPNLYLEKTEQYIPRKKKDHQRINTSADSNGTFYLTRISVSGLVQREPLDKLLGTEQLNKILSNDADPQRRGKLAHQILKLLSNTPIEKLIQPRSQELSDVIKKLTEFDIKLEDPKDLRVRVDEKTWLTHLADFKRRARIPLAVLAVYAMTIPSIAFMQALGRGISDLRTSMLAQSTITTNINSEPVTYWVTPNNPVYALPSRDTLLTHSLDWKVEASGSIDSSGYYTEYTTSPRSWRSAETGATEEIFLPQNLNPGSEFIKLEKRVVLGLRETKILKLPIKDGTKIGALVVRRPNGEPTPFRVFRVVDGTVQIVLENSLRDPIGYFDIDLRLIRSDKPEINAYKKERQLDNTQLLEPAALLFHPYENPEALAAKIRDRFTYTLSLSSLKDIRNFDTSEEFVNAASKQEQCNCDVCNSLLILLASLDPNPQSMLTRAVGYLHGFESPAAGQGTYLTGETRHAYAINEKGEIIDATPSKASEDRLTQTYLQSLYSDNEIDQYEEEWRGHMRDIARGEGVINGLKLTGLLAVGFLAFSSLATIGRRVRKSLSKENLDKAGDNILLSIFSKRDLELAYKFFMGVSWGSHANGRFYDIDLNIPVSFKGKHQALEATRRNLNEERVNFYDRSPRTYEQITDGLSWKDRRVLRWISKLFLYQTG